MLCADLSLAELDPLVLDLPERLELGLAQVGLSLDDGSPQRARVRHQVLVRIVRRRGKSSAGSDDVHLGGVGHHVVILKYQAGTGE